MSSVIEKELDCVVDRIFPSNLKLPLKLYDSQYIFCNPPIILILKLMNSPQEL